jgi:ribonuclease R
VLAESAEQSDGQVPLGRGGPVVQNRSDKDKAKANASPAHQPDLGSPWSRPNRQRREAGALAGAGTDEALGGPISEDVLHEIAEDTSFTERRAAEAERELLEWKKAKFMQQRLGEEFDGLIVSVTKFGLFVELNELFIEGLVPLSTIAGDSYTYHENTRQIIGQRNRQTYSIGDRVRVLVDRVDPVQHKIQFALLQQQPLRGQRRHRKA